MSAPAFATAADVAAFVAADPGLARIAEYVRPRLGDDPAHDLAHCRRVALWTVRLGGGAFDARRAVAAALLHDVVNVPKDSPHRARASELSEAVARELLPAAGFTPEEIDDVGHAVRTHSFSRGETPRSPLGDALQDADRLEALGALGLFRCLATGVRMGAQFFHADDPFARERPLDDRAYSIDHFYTKLLRLPEGMRTEAGRVEAQRRAAFLVATAAALAEEIGVRSPDR